MKWYKKQLDQLKIAKSEAPKSNLDEITKKTSGHSFEARKSGGMKTNIPNPVMTRNRNRPKTDSK